MDSTLVRLYKYADLSDRYFRTILLHPGSGDDPLRCSLRTSLLSETSFEAISYAWGDTTRDRQIACEGRYIPITTNLWTVLQHIRRDTPRVLWADSICINQEDNKEKEQQVSIMGQIYRSADRVLIFLGADDLGHGAKVHSLLEETSSMIRKGLENCGPAPNSFPLLADDAPILKDVRWSSLERMLHQSWFGRGWVVQEAALAKTGRLIWGEHEFSWEELTLTLAWVGARTSRLLDTLEASSIYRLLYWLHHKDIMQTFTTQRFAFGYLELLEVAKTLQFSDARDRIFAFAEVAKNFERYVAIRPNYDTPLSHTYQNLAVAYVRSIKDIQLLDYVRHTEESFQYPCPSWVPRWDINSDLLGIGEDLNSERLKPRGSSAHEPTVVDGSSLRVRGVVLDEVVYASEVSPGIDTDTAGTARNVWRHVCLANETSSYPTIYLIDAFMDTLCNRCCQGAWESWQRKEAAYKVSLLHDTCNVDAEELDRRKVAADHDGIADVIRFMNERLRDKKFILTRRGYMGLTPLITQRGDVSAIVFGCRLPCILRKINQIPQYRIVGGATILGQRPVSIIDEKAFFGVLGTDDCKDWVDWDVEEQDIDLV